MAIYTPVTPDEHFINTTSTPPLVVASVHHVGIFHHFDPQQNGAIQNKQCLFVTYLQYMSVHII